LFCFVNFLLDDKAFRNLREIFAIEIGGIASSKNEICQICEVRKVSRLQTAKNLSALQNKGNFLKTK